MPWITRQLLGGRQRGGWGWGGGERASLGEFAESNCSFSTVIRAPQIHPPFRLSAAAAAPTMGCEVPTLPPPGCRSPSRPRRLLPPSFIPQHATKSSISTCPSILPLTSPRAKDLPLSAGPTLWHEGSRSAAQKELLGGVERIKKGVGAPFRSPPAEANAAEDEALFSPLLARHPRRAPGQLRRGPPPPVENVPLLPRAVPPAAPLRSSVLALDDTRSR